MPTFLLRWNPAISSFKEQDLKHLIKHYPFAPLNWSVWDYLQANPWDSFFMMRVDGEHPGIMMCGCFSSEPKRGNDWSGKNRPTFYCDLGISYAADCATMPYIPLEELQREIPEFDWAHGHSGVLLDKEIERKLNRLWLQFRENNAKTVAEFSRREDWAIDPEAESQIENFNLYKEEIAGWGAEDYHIMDYAHDCVNLDFHIDYVNHIATLKVWFQGNIVLNIICTGLCEIKSELDNSATFTDWFRISAEQKGILHLDSNGIEIFCKHIRFEKGPEFTDCRVKWQVQQS